MAHKNVGLYREEQREAFENARDAVEADPDAPDDPTDGDLVQELAEAYTGFRYGAGAEE